MKQKNIVANLSPARTRLRGYSRVFWSDKDPLLSVVISTKAGSQLFTKEK